MTTLASSLSLSSTSSSTTSAISDRAAQLLTDIQSTFKFKRRNAIVRQVICGHNFGPTLLTEPTKCSNCNQMIWGILGQECKLCKLMTHRKCMQSVDTICIGEHANHRVDFPSCHQIKTKTFLLPTMCDHCGTLIKGLLRQGVECSSCSRKVHHDCRRYHFATKSCNPRESTEQSRRKEPEIYTHRSTMCIEDFEIIRLLGSGTFAKVYLARCARPSSSQQFAIKVINKTNTVVNSDPESLFTEWKALNLGNCPFLIEGHCCFQSRDRLFFVMEYVVGQDLLFHIRKDRKFTEYRAKFYAAEIVLALIHLHKNRVIYRDLKLENVMLDRAGHCKLVDFGMSKILTPDQMLTKTFCGTPSCMSPEILRGDGYGFSTDVWSLGVLLYEMLTGVSPFEAQTEQATYDAIKQASPQFPIGLSYRARSILDGLLTKEPQLRLGCQVTEQGWEAIKNHEFFKFKIDGFESYQWDELWCRIIKPPYTPTDEDQIQDEAHSLVELTPVDLDQLRDVSQSEFEKFSFYRKSFEDRYL